MTTKFRSAERSWITESIESWAEDFGSGGGSGMGGKGIGFRKMWAITQKRGKIMTVFSCD